MSAPLFRDVGGRLALEPCTINEAKRWILAHHRRLKELQGARFAAKVTEYGATVCVAVLGSAARTLGPRVGCVTRVASDGTAPHAASMAISAVVAAALRLGYRRIVSYTHMGEAGTSYRGAGWRPTGITRGGEWSRPSRPRKAAINPLPKIRWEIGPDAIPLSREAAACIPGFGKPNPLLRVHGG